MNEKIGGDYGTATLAILAAGVLATGRAGFHAPPSRFSEIGAFGGAGDWHEAVDFALSGEKRDGRIPTRELAVAFAVASEVLDRCWDLVEVIAVELESRTTLEAHTLDKLLVALDRTIGPRELSRAASMP